VATGRAFDHVLFDRSHAAIDSHELTRQIEADPTLADVRTIVLTAWDDPPETAATDRRRWLTKPIRIAELYECLAPIAPAASPAEPVEGSGSPSSPAFAGYRVLLAEDNEVNTMVASSILARQGCFVATAADGVRALAEYDSGKFDIVLMDCQMPGMNGFEATAAIRAREAKSGRRTPIVALTANAVEGDREHCLSAGMDDYLSKPVSHKTMRTILDRWLAGSKKVGVDRNARADETVAEREPGKLDEEALAVLRDLAGDDDPGLIHRVMTAFLDSSPALLENLRQGRRGRDADAMRAATHALRSSSAVIGAVSLSVVCARVEELARDGNVDDAAASVDDVVREYNTIRAAIEIVVLDTVRSPALHGD
jgi:CheY-like chemotaxis protein/HPt (histidine-containing phosphotransfer) domain-containing protein